MRKAFTLVELLVVIAILALLLARVIGFVGTLPSLTSVVKTSAEVSQFTAVEQAEIDRFCASYGSDVLERIRN